MKKRILISSIYLTIILSIPINSYSQALNKRFTHTVEAVSLKKMYDTLSFLFIGDVMQHIPQINNALINSNKELSTYNFDYAFEHIKPYIDKADIAGANMEFSLAGYPYSGYPTFSAPDQIAFDAKKAGFNVFLTANNHIMDKGKRGAERTLNIYDSLNINHTGCYRDSLEMLMRSPIIINKNNIKIAIINFTYGTNGIKVPHPMKVSFLDTLEIKNSIQRAKNKKADIIIALPHWGNEYQLKQNREQEKLAEFLFREGVRIIIGSHPHVTQDGIIHKNENNNISKFVFYSLGNYISNQSDPSYTQLGLMVYFDIVKDHFTQQVEIKMPKYEYLWTYKPNEFADKYTTIPIEQAIRLKNQTRNKAQYQRMIDTYNNILIKKQIKEKR